MQNKKEEMLEIFKSLIYLALHDLRSRNSIIVGYTELAIEKTDEEEMEDYLTKVLLSGRQTQGIFDLMNDYLSLDLKQLEFVSVAASFEQAQYSFAELKKRNIEITNDCQRLGLRANSSMLTHIFFCLIDNSLRHGGEKLKRIRLSFKENERKDRLYLIYQDDGKGIPSDQKRSIFRQNKEKHGLSLVRKIISVLDWEIKETGKAETDKEKTEKQGARFIISIDLHDRDSKLSYIID